MKCHIRHHSAPPLPLQGISYIHCYYRYRTSWPPSTWGCWRVRWGGREPRTRCWARSSSWTRWMRWWPSKPGKISSSTICQTVSPMTCSGLSKLKPKFDQDHHLLFSVNVNNCPVLKPMEKLCKQLDICTVQYLVCNVCNVVSDEG